MDDNSAKYIYEKVEQQLNQCWCSHLLKDSANNRVNLQYKKNINKEGKNHQQFIHMLKPRRRARKENQLQCNSVEKKCRKKACKQQKDNAQVVYKNKAVNLSKLLENVNKQQYQHRFTFARRSLTPKKQLQINKFPNLHLDIQIDRFKNKQQLKPLGSTRVNSSHNLHPITQKSRDNCKIEAQVQQIEFSEQFSEIKQAESQHIVCLSRLNQSGVSGISRYISKVENFGKLKVYGQIKYQKEQQTNLAK